MIMSFDSVEYVASIGQELVSNFQVARFATTPGLKGSAREVPTRDKLEQLLPRGIAVGTGCVIDSYGNTSRQMDIVLYEREFCPVYSINQDPATTYYPCEGVIAVGEIKTSVGSSELQNIFTKISSVKKLRRFAPTSNDPAGQSMGLDDTVSFRQYGSPQSIVGTKEEEYNQDSKPFDQIFGFALAGSLTLSPKTFCERFVKLAKDIGYESSPSTIAILNQGVLCPIAVPSDHKITTIVISPKEANHIYYVEHQDNFQFLLSRIYTAYRSGRTVELSAFDRYFAKDGMLRLPSGGHIARLS